jgi:hypothetical protein
MMVFWRLGCAAGGGLLIILLPMIAVRDHNFNLTACQQRSGEGAWGLKP